jgi:hypothetical protein
MGDQLRVVFLAGMAAAIARANVARADRDGLPAGPAQRLTFGGSAEARAQTRERVTSAPVPFPVRAGDELLITFEADGALGASKIGNF